MGWLILLWPSGWAKALVLSFVFSLLATTYLFFSPFVGRFLLGFMPALMVYVSIRNWLGYPPSVLGIDGLIWLLAGTYAFIFLRRWILVRSPRLPFSIRTTNSTRVRGGPMTAFHPGDLRDAVFELIMPGPDAPNLLPFIEDRHFDPKFPETYSADLVPEFFGKPYSLSCRIVRVERPNVLAIETRGIGEAAGVIPSSGEEWRFKPEEDAVRIHLRGRLDRCPMFSALALYLINEHAQILEHVAAQIDDRPDRSIWPMVAERVERLKMRRHAKGQPPVQE